MSSKQFSGAGMVIAALGQMSFLLLNYASNTDPVAGELLKSITPISIMVGFFFTGMGIAMIIFDRKPLNASNHFESDDNNLNDTHGADSDHVSKANIIK